MSGDADDRDPGLWSALIIALVIFGIAIYGVLHVVARLKNGG